MYYCACTAIPTTALMQARAHVGRVYNEERASVCLERGVDNLQIFA